MRYITLLKANIKKQKGSFAGILLLMFIITVTLGAVLSIWSNANAYEERETKRLGVGDFVCWILEPENPETMEEEFSEIKDLEKVETKRILFTKAVINGKESSSEVQAAAYDPEKYPYHIMNESLTGFLEEPQELSEGEVYVPVSFTSLYDARVGATMELEFEETGNADTENDGEKISRTFVIKGFFEDPFMGSSMMGMKTVLLSEKAEEDLVQEAKEADVAVGRVLHFFQKEDSTISLNELRSRINETDIGSYIVFSYTRSNLTGFMLILQNICGAFLTVFVLVLLIVAFVVLGHSISSSIEQDYVDMGILKAVGFTEGDLKRIQVIQYVFTAGIGLLAGIPVSRLLASVVGRLIVPVTGILPPTELPVFYSILCFGGILAAVVIFVICKTGRIKKITPIKAIRGGAEDVYFAGRGHAGIHKKGMCFWLAYRQLISGKKQYISACIIAMFLVFFLSVGARLHNWIGNDGHGLMSSMGVASVNGQTYDLGIMCEDEKIREEAEAYISSVTPVVASYESQQLHGTLEGTDYLLNIVSEPEYFHIIEGRSCLYDDEIMVTKILAEELGVFIGDRVTVEYNGKSAEYLITGINQCANDMGSNFSMGKAAFERIKSSQVLFYTDYVLEDSSCSEEIISGLQERFGDNIVIDENTWSGLDGIVTAMNALVVLMYIISAVFILVAVSMTGNKILYKEKKDLGIYRSLGFSSKSLRLAFSLRFGIVSTVGAVCGLVANLFLADTLIGKVLYYSGICDFRSALDIDGIVRPGVGIVALFMIFAWLLAKKIEKVDPEILIAE